MTGSRIFFVFRISFAHVHLQRSELRSERDWNIASTYGVLSERNVCGVWLKGELEK